MQRRGQSLLPRNWVEGKALIGFFQNSILSIEAWIRCDTALNRTLQPAISKVPIHSSTAEVGGPGTPVRRRGYSRPASKGFWAFVQRSMDYRLTRASPPRGKDMQF